MKHLTLLAVLLAVTALLLPAYVHAQGAADNLNSMKSVLDQLFNEMIPDCKPLIDVARALAGLGALFYIAVRVWRHIAHAEPVDFYPLLRPFALGLAIGLYIPMIHLLNGVLQPTVTATEMMMDKSNKSIAELLKQREEKVKESKEWMAYVGETGEGNKEEWYKYTHQGKETSESGFWAKSIGNDVQFAMSKMYYKFKSTIKQWMSAILEVVFQAASLCIDALRTFQLVVLVILGPLVLAFAVFDGFQQSLVHWLARYINIFLWLPVANIFGAIIAKIQENMIKIDMQQLDQTSSTFFTASDTAYLIFMIIGIVGYFTVPSVANYIIHAHGQNSMLQRVTTLVNMGAGMATGNAMKTANAVMHAGRDFMTGQSQGSHSDGGGKSMGHGAAFLHNKLSGDSSGKNKG